MVFVVYLSQEGLRFGALKDGFSSNSVYQSCLSVLSLYILQVEVVVKEFVEFQDV